MAKDQFVVVNSEQERENAKLEKVAKGYRVIMETDDQTIMEHKKRRTWLWLLVFWPMLLFKVTKIATIKLEMDKVFCPECGVKVAGKFCPECGTSINQPMV